MKKKTGKMCPVCQELSDYAELRSEKCPFYGEENLLQQLAGFTAISLK